jgi:hypothetical protein
MPRRNLIALVGSVAFVLVAFWLVTLAFPGPQAAILGKWRTSGFPECNSAPLYFVFTKDAVLLEARGNAPRIFAKVTAIETDGDNHRLRFYVGDRPGLDIAASYRIAGDELTFGDIDWTPEARAKYPGDVAALVATLAAKGDSIGGVFTRFQPFHRCPD